MAFTEALPLDRLGEDDIAGCMALSAEAGWNQTADDWVLFMRHGTVFGLRTEGGPAATGAVLPYSGALAWISMVLVTASRRGACVGTRILETCCAELARRGLLAVLDATPAGERVYRPLGFEPMFKLSRWQGEGRGGRARMSGRIRPMTEGDIAAIDAVDAAAFGARRTFLLENFFRRAPQLAFTIENADGFVLARPGRIATQIGPLVATEERTAASLLDAAIEAAVGPVFLDLCDRWDNLVRQIERQGFTVQRPYLRMALGRRAPFGDPARTFVVAGPEFG